METILTGGLLWAHSQAVFKVSTLDYLVRNLNVPTHWETIYIY